MKTHTPSSNFHLFGIFILLCMVGGLTAFAIHKNSKSINTIQEKASGINKRNKQALSKTSQYSHALGRITPTMNENINATGCPTDTSTSFAGRMDYVFHYLNKDDVPTGMLQEYGIDFLPPENFTGASLNDSNYINMDEWRMLYANLYSYQINDTANLPSLVTINNAFQPYNNPDTINALTVMFYYYNSFKSNAVTSNLVKDSCDQLYDVPGRTQSPYQIDTFLALHWYNKKFCIFNKIVLTFRYY